MGTGEKNASDDDSEVDQRSDEEDKDGKEKSDEYETENSNMDGFKYRASLETGICEMITKTTGNRCSHNKAAGEALYCAMHKKYAEKSSL